MKKIRSKKIIIASIFACTALTIGGVGFASWIITGGTKTAEVNSLSVTAAEVVDQRITLTASVYRDDSTNKTTYGSVNFGPTANNANLIQPSTSGTSEEDLEFGLAVSISCPTKGIIKADDKIVATFTPSTSSGTGLASYINDGTNNYLNFGTKKDSTYTFTYTLGSDDIPSSADTTSKTYVTTLKAKSVSNKTENSTTSASEVSSYDSSLSYWSINFGWGSAFNYKNPADYQGSSTDKLDTTIGALQNIKTAAGNTTWSCVVSYEASQSTSA